MKKLFILFLFFTLELSSHVLMVRGQVGIIDLTRGELGTRGTPGMNKAWFLLRFLNVLHTMMLVHPKASF